MTGWLVCCSAWAAAPAVVIELGEDREYFIETRQQIFTTRETINPLITVPEPNQLIPLERPGASHQNYWIKLSLLNHSQQREWMLDISHAIVERLVVHSLSGTRHRISERGFIKTWPFDLRYGAELTLPPNEVTQVWISVAIPYGVNQPLLSVLPLQRYQEKSSSYSMQLLIALGALVILAVYQIVIFIPTRDPVYAWSALAHLAAAFAWAAQCKALLYGMSLHLHWYWLFLPLFVAMAAAMQFARHYLRVHYPHPLAYGFDTATATIVVTGIAAGLLLPAHQYTWLLTKIMLAGFVLLAAAGLWRMRENMTALRFYLLGISILLLCNLFYWLDQALALHLIENGIVAAARMQLMVLILLMLGLIDRMSLVQKERSQQIQRAGTDPVTGLPNRSAFERDVRAWEAYCKEGILKDFYLSFFEIGNLQTVNREKGRKEGDRLLILIGKWLLQQTGNHNIYRIGGNELLGLTQNSIQWDLGGLEKFLRQEGFRNIDVKIGTSCFAESSCRSSLLKIADERLHNQAMR